MSSGDLLTNLRVARPNGGFKLHLVPRGTYTALCGQRPQNDGYQFSRGRWLFEHSTHHAAGQNDCEKCRREAMAVLGGSLEEEVRKKYIDTVVFGRTDSEGTDK